jgi:hypothetical protein
MKCLNRQTSINQIIQVRTRNERLLIPLKTKFIRSLVCVIPAHLRYIEMKKISIFFFAYHYMKTKLKTRDGDVAGLQKWLYGMVRQ